LNYRDPVMGSLKSPCTTSYSSSIDTIALIAKFLRKSRFWILASRSKMADLRHLGF